MFRCLTNEERPRSHKSSNTKMGGGEGCQVTERFVKRPPSPLSSFDRLPHVRAAAHQVNIACMQMPLRECGLG